MAAQRLEAEPLLGRATLLLERIEEIDSVGACGLQLRSWSEFDFEIPAAFQFRLVDDGFVDVAA